MFSLSDSHAGMVREGIGVSGGQRRQHLYNPPELRPPAMFSLYDSHAGMFREGIGESGGQRRHPFD